MSQKLNDLTLNETLPEDLGIPLNEATRKESINNYSNRLFDKYSLVSKKMFKDPNKLRKSLSLKPPIVPVKNKKQCFVHLNLKST